jgi:hypothetical protein
MLKYSFLIIVLLSLFFITCKKSSENSTGGNNLPGVSNTNIVSVSVVLAKTTINAQVTSDGGSPITGRGICYDTVSSPTISNNKVKDDTTAIGTFTVALNGLKPNIKYYARSYATNKNGTSYGNEVNFTIEVNIGSYFGGGIVFYLDPSGKHGLISHKQGLNYSAEWGCKGVNIPNTKTEIGSGQANTTAIIGTCATAGIAARFSDDLESYDFKDWYLPSKEELNLMYQHRDLIGFDSDTKRWSSSQGDANTAWAQDFDTTLVNALPVLENKDISHGVRPIRSF